jgi:carbamoyltransferase
MGTELDVLVVGNCVLRKEQQDKTLVEDYKEKYELD